MITVLQKRFDIFESKRFSFLDELNTLTAEQLAFKPNTDHWNILDIVQHLMLAEHSFLLQLTEKQTRIRKSRFNPIVGSFIVWMVFKFGIRVKAPVTSVIPKGTMPLDDSRAQWNEKRTGLKYYLEALDQKAARQKIFFHPIKGTLSPIGLIDFLIVHFDHHMKQIKRIRHSPHYPN